LLCAVLLPLKTSQSPLHSNGSRAYASAAALGHLRDGDDVIVVGSNNGICGTAEVEGESMFTSRIILYN
jgi:hypothetical protein